MGLTQKPGSLDQTFVTKELGFGNSTGPSNSVLKTVLQVDGKIIIAGSFSTYNGVSRKGIARLNKDGSLDNSFNPGNGVNGKVNDIEIQVDGKIIIAGDFTTFNGTEIKSVARLYSDGTLDLTFRPVLTFSSYDSEVYDVSIQNDGKILICGDLCIPEFGGCTNYKIVRLTENGFHDNSFSTVFLTSVYKLEIQMDGMIIIVGNLSVNIGSPYIFRLFSNGSRDYSFDPNLGANNLITNIALQNDGKILIAGDFTSYDGILRNSIARLNPNGSLDQSFNVGSGTNSIKAISLQNDGKIIIVGNFTSYNGILRHRIARLHPDGLLDISFNSELGANDVVETLFITSENKIIIGGDFISYDLLPINRIASLNIDGTLDLTFNPSLSINNSVLVAMVRDDKKIIIGGDFVTYDNLSRNRLARLNPDGTLDSTFNIGLGANNRIRSISAQNDDKIIVGGDFTTFNGLIRNRIARIKSDGSIDDTFNFGTGPNDIVRNTIIQNDGKIIAVGNFTLYNGVLSNRIARINTDGSLDPDFNTGSGANGFIMTAAIQDDGKIIIGGDFSTYNGIPRNRIARLNVDGSLDFTFNPGSGANQWVRTITIQNDGKIIIGGAFNTFNGTTKNYIACLNVNGSLNDNFNIGLGPNNIVRTSALQNDGKIIIAGDFTSYNTIVKNYIARLNFDGTIDTTFNTGSGANNSILSLNIQNDGKIILAGAFSTYDGIIKNRILKVMGRDGCSYSLNSNTNTENQSVCINTPITSIKYNTIGITDATVSGLPPGVIGHFNSNILTIDGTPTEIDTFHYTITFTGDCTTSFTNMLIVADTLTAAITGDSEICEGNSTTFTAAGGGSYLWNTGETGSSINKNQMGLYSVTVISDLGCASKGDIFLTVNPNPIANIIGESEICFGRSVLWTAIGGIKYNWDNGDTSSSIIVNTERIYSVTVTDNKGCYSTSIKTLSIVNSPPAIISGTNIICEGTNSTFTASGGDYYLWSTGETTSSITINQLGTFYVTVTTLDGCISTGSKTLTYYTSSPVIIDGDSLVCKGMSTTWSVSDGLSYIWSTGETSQAINLNTAGTYSITVTDFNGCMSSTYKTFNLLSNPDAKINVINENCDGSSSLQWAKQFGGPSEGGAANAVITDKFGNVFSTGQYYGYGVDFDPGPNTFYLVTGSGSSAYISKLDKDGNFIWAKSIGSAFAEGTCLVMDENGNLFASGRSGVYTTYIIKIAPNGDVLFEKSFETTYERISTSIVVDNLGNVYTSYSDGSLEKYDHEGSFIWKKNYSYGSRIRVAINKNDNVYIVGRKSGINIAQIDTLGNLMWEKNIDGNGSGENNAIKIDNTGNLYITGSFSRKWDFDPGNEIFYVTAKGDSDAFILKLDQFGNFIWVSQMGGNDNTSGISITVDELGNIYAVGKFSETTDFDPGSGNKILTSIGYDDGYIVKLSSSGMFLGVAQFGSDGEDSAVYSVAVDETGYAYITGYFAGTVDFDPSNDIFNLSHNGSYRDFFVVKLCKNFIPNISSQESTTFCEGGEVRLMSSFGSSYLWGNGETTQSIQTSLPGIYTLTVTNSNGCSNSVSKEIKIASNPVVTIEGNSSLCDSNTVTWTAFGGISYLWNTGITTPSINLNTLGEYNVSVTNEEGCTTIGTKSLDSGSGFNVLVSGNTHFCEGNGTTLTVNEGTTFLWNTGATSQAIFVSSSGEFRVTVTDENGCSAISMPIIVTINPLLVPSVDIISSNNAICEGDIVTFTAMPINGGALPTYQWNINGVLQTETGPSFGTNTLVNNQQVLCLMTSTEECLTQPTAQSNTISIAVNPLLTPEVSISMPFASIFPCQEVTFLSMSSNGGLNPTYQWFLNGNPSSTLQSYTASDLKDGDQVYCLMTSSAICKDTSLVQSNTITMVVIPLTQPLISISGDTITSSNYTGSEYTYSWFFNGDQVSTSPFIICNQFGNGSYYLNVNYNGCFVTSNTIDIVCTVSTKDISSYNYFSLFPNPTLNLINISGKTQPNQIYNLEIYNIVGQKILEDLLITEGDVLYKSISLENLVNGIYIIEIKANNFSQQYKVYKIE